MAGKAKSKVEAYPEGIFDPRKDNTGITANYNGLVSTKSNRSSDSDAVVTPYKMNPYGTVRRKGTQG